MFLLFVNHHFNACSATWTIVLISRPSDDGCIKRKWHSTASIHYDLISWQAYIFCQWPVGSKFKTDCTALAILFLGGEATCSEGFVKCILRVLRLLGLSTASAMLPKQARGAFRKHITKPSEQVAAPPSRWIGNYDDNCGSSRKPNLSHVLFKYHLTVLCVAFQTRHDLTISTITCDRADRAVTCHS